MFEERYFQPGKTYDYFMSRGKPKIKATEEGYARVYSRAGRQEKNSAEI